MKEENHFVGSVLKELEAFTNMDGVLRTIWTSPVARNSIESFTEEEKKEIQKEAENIILEQLFQQERDKNENGKLHIYGYGKLENVEMDLSMLTVLYGENEAGNQQFARL